MTAAIVLTTAAPTPYRTFFHYLIPSVVGLLSISTASVVDGLLVARFIGPAGLSAINLLIPAITFYFGAGLMLAVGSSVRVGHLLAAGEARRAGALFGNALLLLGLFALLLIAAGILLREPLFDLLGAPAELRPLLRDYFDVLLPGVLPQLIALLFYYHLRGVGFPRRATAALALGALLNILLDWLFLSVLRQGIAAAAAATVAAQLLQCGLLWLLLWRLPHRLPWHLDLRRLGEVVRAAANGFAEFINEISVGLVLGALHWLLLREAGVDALAGFALVNYSLFVNCMIHCAIAEVVYTLISQHAGQGAWTRVYFRAGAQVTAVFATAYTAVLLLLGPSWIEAVFSAGAARHALEYLHWIWPAFFACGFNLVYAARFTGQQDAAAASAIALLRSLLLPLGLLALFAVSRAPVPLVVALPAAEWLTLAAAGLLALKRAQPAAPCAGLQQL